MNKKNIIDICIVGGGYIGLATALAIKTFAKTLEISVLDAAPSSAINNDSRAFAITAAGVHMLSALGIWQNIAKSAQPIDEMIISDSQLNDTIRPTFLTFATDTSASPFAYMVENKLLIAEMREKAKKLGILLHHSMPVDTFATSEATINISAESSAEKTISAKLLIAADGGNSKMRAISQIKTFHKTYSQMGIVATIAHSRPHHNKAYEHFLPNGPFATLPLSSNKLANNKSCLVWSENKKLAEKIIASNDIEFQLELEKRLANILGEVKIIGKKNAYPLALTLAREFVKPRFALVGDAAHAIHPIAGQGLNLGLKDAAALAETIIDAHRLGLDIGSLNVLQRYQQWRRFDTIKMGVITDQLNELFSNNNDFLRTIRTLGMGLINKMPFVKQQFIKQASGYEKNSPALLLGQAI